MSIPDRSRKCAVNCEKERRTEPTKLEKMPVLGDRLVLLLSTNPEASQREKDGPTCVLRLHLLVVHKLRT